MNAYSSVHRQAKGNLIPQHMQSKVDW